MNDIIANFEMFLLSLEVTNTGLQERDWLSKYQELSAELQSLQEIGAPPTPHKRAELEELVLEQDKSNAMLRDSMFKLRQEIRLCILNGPRNPVGGQ